MSPKRRQMEFALAGLFAVAIVLVGGVAIVLHVADSDPVHSDAAAVPSTVAFAPVRRRCIRSAVSPQRNPNGGVMSSAEALVDPLTSARRNRQATRSRPCRQRDVIEERAADDMSGNDSECTR